MHELVQLKLRKAYPAAVGRLRALPGCRALFEQLSADGVEMLAATIYYATNASQEQSMCRQGSAALSMVGSPQVRLCPVFGGLANDSAAMLLIHEALHFAGLPEQPQDPSAMSSREINRMVADRCGL